MHITFSGERVNESYPLTPYALHVYTRTEELLYLSECNIGLHVTDTSLVSHSFSLVPTGTNFDWKFA